MVGFSVSLSETLTYQYETELTHIMRDKHLIPQPGIFKSCNTIYNNLHLVSILSISSCTSLHHILKGIPFIIFYLAASMPRVFSTSKVLLDVV